MNLMKNKWMSAYAVVVGILMGGCLIVDEHDDGHDDHNDTSVRYGHHSNTTSYGPSSTSGTSGGSGTSGSSSGSNTSGPSNTSSTSDTSAPCPEPDAVCGADGVTYDSSCQASRKKVRVAHKGACPVPCFKDSECGQGELCVQGGVCEVVVCAMLADDDTSQEVCASDGFTYKTDCDARQARLSIAHQGCCVD